MKILINENQLNLIKETIRPSEAYDDIGAVRTVCNGKRGLAFITLDSDRTNEIRMMALDADLHAVHVPSNPHNAFIVYNPKYEKQAHELLKIAEKYDGYLDAYATEEDTREIGRLLEYDPNDVEEFINKINKKRYHVSA